MSTQPNPYDNQNQPNEGYNNYAGAQQPYGAGAYAPPSPDSFANLPSDTKSLALLIHVGTLIATYASGTLLGFAVPLIFWLFYKDKKGYGYIRATAAGAFNFSFSMWIINMIATIITIVTFGVGIVFVWPIWVATGIAMLVFHIMAAVKTNKGESYTYPLQTKILS